MSKVNYVEIYQSRADDYEAMVAAEDCDHNLLPAIEAITKIEGASILEVGVGTGRITRLLTPKAARLIGIERSPSMLAVAEQKLEEITTRVKNWIFHCADARSLPVDDGWADLAIAGWVFGHLRSWHPETWRTEIAKALQEMRRALKPKGTLILLETLGTGQESPTPPTEALAEYFTWLEDVHHMKRVAIRTDYLFQTVEQAASATAFFFGQDFASRVREHRWSRIPECTGLWYR